MTKLPTTHYPLDHLAAFAIVFLLGVVLCQRGDAQFPFPRQ